jgi:hypothetical protein
MAYGHLTIADDWFVVSNLADPNFSVTTREILENLTGVALSNHGDYGLRIGPNASPDTFDMFHKQTLPIAQQFTGTGVSTVGSNEFEDPGYTFTAADEDLYVEILNATDPGTSGLHLITSVSGGKAILNGILASESGLDWNLRDGDSAVQRVECVSFTDATEGGLLGSPLAVASRQNPFDLDTGYKLLLYGSNLMLVQNDNSRPINDDAAYVTLSSLGMTGVNRYFARRIDTWREGNDMRIRAYVMADADCSTMLTANPAWRHVMDVVHRYGNTTAQIITIPGITQISGGSGKLTSTPVYKGAGGLMTDHNGSTSARYVMSPRIPRGA